MPSTSPAQHRLMEAVKHNKKFAQQVGIPQRVGREFVSADEKAERRQGEAEHKHSGHASGYGR